jgi:hypothetical protein
VALVEHVAQLDQRGEVEAAVDQVIADQRKPRQQPRGRGATKRRGLGEPEWSVQNENSDGKPRARAARRRSISPRQRRSSTSKLRSCLRIWSSRPTSAESERSLRVIIIHLYPRFLPPHRSHRIALGATNRQHSLHRTTSSAQLVRCGLSPSCASTARRAATRASSNRSLSSAITRIVMAGWITSQPGSIPLGLWSCARTNRVVARNGSSYRAGSGQIVSDQGTMPQGQTNPRTR